MKGDHAHLSLTGDRSGRRFHGSLLVASLFALVLMLLLGGCRSRAQQAFDEHYSTYVALEPSNQVKAEIKRTYVKRGWVPGKMVLLEKETKETSVWSSEQWELEFLTSEWRKVLQYNLLATKPDEVTCVMFAFRRDNHDVDVHIVDVKTKEVVAFRNFKGSWQEPNSWAPGVHYGGHRSITWDRDILPWVNWLAHDAGLEKKPRKPWNLREKVSAMFGWPLMFSWPRWLLVLVNGAFGVALIALWTVYVTTSRRNVRSIRLASQNPPTCLDAKTSKTVVALGKKKAHEGLAGIMLGFVIFSWSAVIVWGCVPWYLVLIPIFSLMWAACALLVHPFIRAEDGTASAYLESRKGWKKNHD